MSLWEIIILLIISGVCGSIAQSLVGYSRGGCILSIVIGFIGAAIGTWIAKKFSLPDFFVFHIGRQSFPIIWSIIGAVIFTSILNVVSSHKK